MLSISGRLIAAATVVATLASGCAHPLHTAAVRPARACPKPSSASAASFPSVKVGWVLLPRNKVGCSSELRITRNGGRSFSTVSTPPGNFLTLVASSAGTAWLGGRSLYVTHGSGRHWRSVAAPGPLDQLALAGREPVAIGRRCARRCKVFFVRLADGKARSLGPAGEDELITRGKVVVVVARRRLAVSRDAGRTFQRRSAGCRWFLGAWRSVAIDSAGTLWTVCGGEPGAGQQAKWVYRSDDLGRHWSNVHVRPVGPQHVGYVNALAAPAPNRLVLICDRGGLAISTDGGRRWRRARPNLHGYDPFGAWLTFPDARHGYAWISPSSSKPWVFRTNDGGLRWSRVAGLR